VPPESRDLQGRVALVTGGGRGIGRAHCLLLAERGAAVAVCDVGAAMDGSGIDSSVAAETAHEIRILGGEAHAVPADISTFDGASAAVEEVVRHFGGLQIVVNNAGIVGGGSLESADEAALGKVFAVNFYGMIGVTKAAWPHLKAARWGRVVNTVSEVAFDSKMASGSSLGYGSAKAAVWSATIALAREGRDFGITVNAISPGALTRMNEAMFAAAPPPPTLDLDPRHVARVLGWLVSDEAGDVTGRVIHAAAGEHREYVMERRRETDLTARLNSALQRDG
jgi:NAD(P)-dependent dehydrogenase (short-subunit alcohol dehydrogenase family)